MGRELALKMAYVVASARDYQHAVMYRRPTNPHVQLILSEQRRIELPTVSSCGGPQAEH